MKTHTSHDSGQTIRAVLFLILLFAISAGAYYAGKEREEKLRSKVIQANEDKWRFYLFDVEKSFAPPMESQDEHIILGVIKGQKRLTLILSTSKDGAIVRSFNSDRILSKVDEFSIGSKLVFDPVSRCYGVIAPSVIPMPKPYTPKLSSQK